MPGRQDDIEVFVESLAALGVGEIVAFVGARQAAAADAELKPTVADVVDRGDLLCRPERIPQGQYADSGADLNALGAGRYRGCHAQRRGKHGPRWIEVRLREPEGVEPQTLRLIDVAETLPKRTGKVSPLPDVKLREGTKLHLRTPIICSGARYGS